MNLSLLDPAGRFEATFDAGISDLDAEGPNRLTVERIEDIGEVREKGEQTDCIATVGESAFLSLTPEFADIPVLPLGVNAGVPSVPCADFEDALASLTEGTYSLVESPTISVERADHRYRALMDVMAVTAEPARISEFRAVETATGTVFDRVRADGIVVSGPAGTPGYGSAAGGPILGPGVDGMAVVPIGSFRTSRPTWVISPPVEIEVVRGEVSVSLAIDDEEVGPLPVGEPVHLDWGEPLEIVAVPETVRPLQRSSSRNE